MARPKKQLTDAEAAKMRDVEAYTHGDKKRTNNPPVGMAQHDKAEERVKTYQFDPHLDPTLQWAGKAEGMSFDVPTSSIHILHVPDTACIRSGETTIQKKGKDRLLLWSVP